MTHVKIFGELIIRAILIALLAAAVAISFNRAFGQEPPVVEQPDQLPAGEGVKTIAFVTWDVIKHVLRFEYQEGVCRVPLKEGRCKSEDVFLTKKILYEIDPDNATMSDMGQTPIRHFSKLEATKLHQVLDFLFNYAAESHDWHQKGEGLKPDPSVKAKVPLPPAAGKFQRLGAI